VECAARAATVGFRTAPFCWLNVLIHGVTCILRIEDLDRERLTPEALNAILEGMKWLGLDHDEGPFYQTQRMQRYGEVIRQFLRRGRKSSHCQTKGGRKDQFFLHCKIKPDRRPGSVTA